MMKWAVIAAALLTAIGLCLLLWWLLRRYAGRVTNGAGDRADKVHRLRRTLKAGSLAGLLLGLAVAAAPWVYLIATGPGGAHPLAGVGLAVLVVAGAVSVVCYVLPVVGVYRGIRPAYARLRGIQTRAAGQGRALGVGVVFGLVPVALWLAAVLAPPHHGPGHLLALLAAFLLSIVLVNGLLVPLWLVALRARRLDPPDHDRFTALAARMGVRLRDIRAFAGRQERVANAVQVGVLPGLRYVLVSDYLLENLTESESEAVLAHELAHIRGRHILVKIGAMLAVFVGYAGLAVLAAFTLPGVAAGVVGLLALLALLTTPFLVRGLVGIRLERRADRVAAEVTGAGQLADALERVGELNDTRRSTGRIWALITQHPGLQQRLDDLRAQAPQAPADSHAATEPAQVGRGTR